MVYLTLQGDVQGKTLNYYITLEECYTAEPGVGYVCLEDTPTVGERL